MIRLLLCLPIMLYPMMVQATCPQYFYPQATVYTPYVQPKIHQTFYVFTPGLAVGLTHSGYGPAPEAPKANPCSAEIKTLRDEIDRLKASLAPPIAPQAPPMAPVGERPSESAIVRHCAVCHDTGVAKTLGGGIELSAFGQVLKLSPALAGKVMNAANPVKGTMPKDHPRLTGEQFNAVVKELIAQQSQ